MCWRRWLFVVQGSATSGSNQLWCHHQRQQPQRLKQHYTFLPASSSLHRTTLLCSISSFFNLTYHLSTLSHFTTICTCFSTYNQPPFFNYALYSSYQSWADRTLLLNLIVWHSHSQPNLLIPSKPITSQVYPASTFATATTISRIGYIAATFHPYYYLPIIYQQHNLPHPAILKVDLTS